MNGFRAPRPGENIMYICLDCKKNFSAPMAGQTAFLKVLKKPLCPFCKSKNVGKDPFVRY